MNAERTAVPQKRMKQIRTILLPFNTHNYLQIQKRPPCDCLSQGGRLYAVPDRGLEFCRTGGSWEWQYVTDVAHTGDVHNQALKAQTIAGMLGATVFAQVEVP